MAKSYLISPSIKEIDRQLKEARKLRRKNEKEEIKLWKKFLKM